MDDSGITFLGTCSTKTYMPSRSCPTRQRRARRIERRDHVGEGRDAVAAGIVDRHVFVHGMDGDRLVALARARTGRCRRLPWCRRGPSSSPRPLTRMVPPVVLTMASITAEPPFFSAAMIASPSASASEMPPSAALRRTYLARSGLRHEAMKPPDMVGGRAQDRRDLRRRALAPPARYSGSPRGCRRPRSGSSAWASRPCRSSPCRRSDARGYRRRRRPPWCRAAPRAASRSASSDLPFWPIISPASFSPSASCSSSTALT